MSTQTDYTPDQWATLRLAPVAIGQAVAYASDSGGIGTAREEGALLKAFDQPSDEALGTPLIMAVIASLKAELPGVAAVDSGDYLQQALQSGASARDILAAKADANEAERFKTWLVSIAERVASASKEGGFLGIGGKRVSAAEVAVIDQLTAVLYHAPTPTSEREMKTAAPAILTSADSPEVF